MRNVCHFVAHDTRTKKTPIPITLSCGTVQGCPHIVDVVFDCPIAFRLVQDFVEECRLQWLAMAGLNDRECSHSTIGGRLAWGHPSAKYRPLKVGTSTSKMQ